MIPHLRVLTPSPAQYFGSSLANKAIVGTFSLGFKAYRSYTLYLRGAIYVLPVPVVASI